MNDPSGGEEQMKNRESREFEEIILCHFDVLYRMARRLTRQLYEADDLVQETIFRAYAAYDAFELREYGPRPWLLKIMQNVFYSSCAESYKSPTLMDDLSLDDMAADIEQEPLVSFITGEVDWEKIESELRDAIMTLAPDYRLLIVLWALGGLNYLEIAQVMDCPVGTVMSRLYRARKQLSKELYEYAHKRGFLRGSRAGK